MVRRARTHVHRRALGSRLRAALCLAGLGLVFSGSTVAWMAAAQAQPAFATTLPPNSLPLHNATADAAQGCPEGGAYWHFVLTPNNGSAFASIVLNVGGTIYSFTGFPPIVANGSQADNVFVPVPAGHVVGDLETDGSYAVYSGDPSQFVLSGVCAGESGGTTTTTAAPTTTTAAPTTTIAAPTTTTAAPTTTTAAPTTTTAAPTTTTAAPTTTTAAPTTTTSCDSEECSTTTTAAPASSTVLPSCIGPAIACNQQPTTTAGPTTIATASVPAAPTTSTSTGSAVEPAQQLAFTGNRTGPLVAAAAGLIALGIVALALGGRRPGSQSQR